MSRSTHFYGGQTRARNCCPGKRPRETGGRRSRGSTTGADRHRRRLRQFEPYLPTLSAQRTAILDEVRARGASTASLDALDLPGTAELKSAVQALMTEFAPGVGCDQDSVRFSRQRLHEQPAVWQWGLSEPLLDMVENYLGLPARYVGPAVRCERATGETVGVRQWHRDIEDRRMLKLLIWLNDVDDQGGPFEFVERAHTEDLTRSMRYVSGYISDEAVEQRVPRSEWRRATGPTWTCVFTDPRSIFHRAMPPVRRDRYSLTFFFTSRSPLRSLPTAPVTDRERELATRGLNPRQLACLPRGYTR
jgi:hypothetical protein